MSTIRLKDLWMVRTAVERLIHANLPKEDYLKLAGMVEVLHDAFTDYQISRQRLWKKLGLDKPPVWWKFWIDREQLVNQFNEEVAIIAETEVNLPPAVPISSLTRLDLKTVDFVALKNLGVLSGD